MKILAPIHNYEGRPFCCIENDEYLFCIDNGGGVDTVVVSKHFYDAWCEEFTTQEELGLLIKKEELATELEKVEFQLKNIEKNKYERSDHERQNS